MRRILHVDMDAFFSSLAEFTDSEPEIRRAAFDCLGRFELKKKARLIGFRVSNLKKAESE